MAQNAYFFDGVYFNDVYDRAYNSDDFANYFAELVGDGVVYNVSTALQVVAATGMQVTVSKGSAYLRGRKYENTAALALTVPTAHGSLQRIDRLVIRLDKTNRTIAAVVVSGTPSATPTAPNITQSADVFELSLARIAIGAGVTAITSANITDERLDDAVCGIVTGLIQHIDASTLFAQLTAQFNLWFQAMQNQLTTEAAGNLQTQINALNGQIGYNGTSGGTAPNYTMTINNFTLTAGVKVELKIHADANAAASLNITSHNTTSGADTVLGSKAIVDSYGSQITYLKANSYLTLVYTGTAFQVIGLSTQYARYA